MRCLVKDAALRDRLSHTMGSIVAATLWAVSVWSRTLMIQGNEPNDAPGPHADALAGTATASVLIVEDNTTTRSRMVHVLTAGGYLVQEAADGRDALTKASATAFDAIVLDLVMPNIDG